MFTPDGIEAGDMDKIMLLVDWARTRKAKIFAIGAPTFPTDPCISKTFIKHFEEIAEASQKAHELLEISDAEINHQAEIIACGAAIGYGDPAGDIDPRVTVAEVLSEVYKQDINHKNIIFTVGAAGALHAIFNVIKADTPDGLIVTTLPYYPLYKAGNNLYPIKVMKEPGYRLTAAALEKTLKKIEEKQKYKDIKISAFLLCNPNNPTGSVIDREEGRKIAEILNRYSVPIICDEAYAGLQLYGECTSFTEIACDFPNVIKNIIGIRTGTKDSSAAGERLAFIYGFNDELLTKIKASNIAAYGHAPRASQVAYAQAIQNMYGAETKPLTAKKINFYRSQVEFVAGRLKAMGAEMPDPGYKVFGTFYIMCDLSDLIGMPIPAEAKKALGDKANVIVTDEDIAYSLLFEYGFAIAPLSYFGVNPSRGQLRITCSAGLDELTDLTQRLEAILHKTHFQKFGNLIEAINKQLDFLGGLPLARNELAIQEEFTRQLADITSKNNDLCALILKEKNIALQKLLTHITDTINVINNKAIIIQRNVRRFFESRQQRLTSAKKTWDEKEFKDKEPELPKRDEQLLQRNRAKIQLTIDISALDLENRRNCINELKNLYNRWNNNLRKPQLDLPIADEELSLQENCTTIQSLIHNLQEEGIPIKIDTFDTSTSTLEDSSACIYGSEDFCPQYEESLLQENCTTIQLLIRKLKQNDILITIDTSNITLEISRACIKGLENFCSLMPSKPRDSKPANERLFESKRVLPIELLLEGERILKRNCTTIQSLILDLQGTGIPIAIDTSNITLKVSRACIKGLRNFCSLTLTKPLNLSLNLKRNVSL